MTGVPLDDRGLLLGDGLFETLLWRGGGLILAEDHARRMAEGAVALGLPAPVLADFIGCATEAVVAADLAAARGAVRVTLTAGSGGRGLDRPAELRPRLFATAAPAAAPSGSASLIVATVRRNQASPASRLKSLAYLDNVLARREAAAVGADEAVMLNTAGHVACTAAANIFWLKHDILFTPAPQAGCLGGIMARQVRAAAVAIGVEVREVHESQAALSAADGLFLTSSLIGVRPAHLSGRAAGAQPLVARLAAAVALYA